MKKSILCAIILILCAAMIFAGCGKDDTKKEEVKEQTPAATEADTGYDTTSPKSASWFDSAVFVGDSVTLKLSYYCEEHPEALGEAAFYCAGSLGYTNALWDLDAEDTAHPEYEGTTHLVEDCVEITGKKNVFIMLGMNDIGMYGTQGAMDSCKEIVSRILKKSPDAHLYLQSVTPMIENGPLDSDSFNNTLIKEFDGLLKTYCDENGYKYLDVYSVMADANGNLPMEYCSDPEAMGLHFSDVACEKWADYLKNNA